MAYVDKVKTYGQLRDMRDTKGRAMLGPVEETNPATHSHQKGTYFTYNDLLYYATADIAVGDRLNSYNCVQTTVGNELGKISSAEKNETAPFAPMVMPEPSGFSWTNSPLHGKIKTDYNGNYTVDFDISLYKNDEGTVKYISPDGDDENSGDNVDDPMKSIKTAYDGGADTIVLLPGVYRRANTMYGTPITRNLNIIGRGEEGNPVIVSTTNPTTNWTRVDGYSHVYQATRSSMSNAIDIAHTNENGDYVQYAHVETIAEVHATEGSWAHIEGVAYVHAIDDAMPLEENGILLMAGLSNYNLFEVTDGHFYIENVVCLEGGSPLKVHADASGMDIRVFANKCKFVYSLSEDNDAVTVQGATLAIFCECEASYSQKDGFCYHGANSIAPKVIEINCVAKHNGNASDANDQGSTIHNGGSIIRIGDIVTQSYGPNFGDTHDNTESWNINCVGYGSIHTISDPQDCNFWVGSGATMYLDGCVGFGSKGNIFVSENGAIYIRNARFTGVLAIDTSLDPIYY